MNFRPLHDRILINRIEEKETVKGGIVIPDSAKEKPQEGEVVAVGKGKKEKDGQVVPLDVKAGDRILFGKYSGTEIKMDNEEYLIDNNHHHLIINIDNEDYLIDHNHQHLNNNNNETNLLLPFIVWVSKQTPSCSNGFFVFFHFILKI